MRYLGDKDFDHRIGKWVNFSFPKSGRMSLCICSLPPKLFLQAEGQREAVKVSAEVLLWSCLLPFVEARQRHCFDLALAQVLSDGWKGSWKNWSWSHQPRSEPLICQNIWSRAVITVRTLMFFPFLRHAHTFFLSAVSWPWWNHTAVNRCKPVSSKTQEFDEEMAQIDSVAYMRFKKKKHIDQSLLMFILSSKHYFCSVAHFLELLCVACLIVPLQDNL